ncbi:hypothetical protein VTK26DRAFT_5135 [Humicola hyalothermophila]
MGASMSTLVGWTVVIGCVYIFGFGLPGKKKTRESLRAASQQKRFEDRQHNQNRKEPKEKAKRQRAEAHSKDTDTAQLKARAQKPSPPRQPVDYSTDDGVDNREFARQLASVKQGTTLNGPKKSDEKRQRSVKQSRAQIIDSRPEANENKVSAPSSTAGVDADDDESSTASPEVRAISSRDVSDMLEPSASGPSVLRLTDTDKAKPKKEKKAKAPEKTETKKQRQNRQKAEAAKALREEAEKQRKVDMEAQRRLARISEGRAAKDGSAFMAAQAKSNAWNGSPSSNTTNGDFVPVQPLDTFDTGSYTDVSVSKSAAAPAAKPNVANSWMSSLPSEEEQMEMLREEEQWDTVKSKKNKKKKEAGAESPVESEPTVVQPQPAAATKPQSTSNGSHPAIAKTTTTKAQPVSRQSAFAALSTNDEPEEEEEEEWDV